MTLDTRCLGASEMGIVLLMSSGHVFISNLAPAMTS